jgi:hypothetical protein
MDTGPRMGMLWERPADRPKLDTVNTYYVFGAARMGQAGLGSNTRHVIHRIVYVLVLATSSTARCTGNCEGIRHIVYRCPPRDLPHTVLVPATSSTAWCTGHSARAISSALESTSCHRRYRVMTWRA